MSLRRWVLLAVFTLGACAGRYRVEGTIEHPAELPIRSFPPVAIVAAPDEDSTTLAERLAEALSSDGTPVLLGAEALGAAGVRVDLALRYSPRVETRWSSRPENVCGAYGCYVRQVTYPYEVLFLIGELEVRISDPQSGATLAARVDRDSEIGPDSAARRAAIRYRLVGSALSWFSARPETLRETLPRVGGSRYGEALDLARDGNWDESLTILRTIRAAREFDARPIEDRAGVHRAIAIALRFSSEARSNPVPALEEALRAARDASAMVPSDEGRALEASLTSQLEEARVLTIQRGGDPEAPPLSIPDAYR